jgi:hypothetical protein
MNEPEAGPGLRGYQVIVHVTGEHAGPEIINDVPRRLAEQVLRRWHLPRWLRRSKGITLTCKCGDAAFYSWSEISQIRIQPQAEAIDEQEIE